MQFILNKIQLPEEEKGKKGPQAGGKTSQELRMLSSVTINCQVTMIVMNPGSQLSVM